MTINLPESLKRNIKTTFGSRGEEWLLAVPSYVAQLCKSWQLELVGEFDDLTYNFVALVKDRNQKDLVLKVGPHSKDILRQAQMLEIYNGTGAVRLVAHDKILGALLLERAFKPAKVTTEAFCEVAMLLQKSKHSADAGKKFPHISIWGLGFEKFLRTQTKEATQAREAGLTNELVVKADDLFKKLVANSQSETLLHGDLHQFNLLIRENGEWVAIDPKGVCGDPCYEVGAYLRNLPQPSQFEIKLISNKLGFDERRIHDWGFAQAVLAAIWSIGDGPETVQKWLRAAESLA